MLWSEMDEHQRELHTKSARHWLPADTELLELVDILWCGWECDYAAALIRTADGSVRVKILAGVSDPGGGDPLAMLEERIETYEGRSGTPVDSSSPHMLQ